MESWQGCVTRGLHTCRDNAPAQFLVLDKIRDLCANHAQFRMRPAKSCHRRAADRHSQKPLSADLMFLVSCSSVGAVTLPFLASTCIKPDTSEFHEDTAGKGQAKPPIEVLEMEHPKVVNSAWFSPVTGQKIMTTCIDNRIRIWDTLFNAAQPADREIIHSHVSINQVPHNALFLVHVLFLLSILMPRSVEESRPSQASMLVLPRSFATPSLSPFSRACCLNTCLLVLAMADADGAFCKAARTMVHASAHWPQPEGFCASLSRWSQSWEVACRISTDT